MHACRFPKGVVMPAAPHPLVLRGREALERGDLRVAEQSAEERLKTAGRDVNALELRALIQQQRGQFGQAARTLDTIIGIDRRAGDLLETADRLLGVSGVVAVEVR